VNRDECMPSSACTTHTYLHTQTHTHTHTQTHTHNAHTHKHTHAQHTHTHCHQSMTSPPAYKYDCALGTGTLITYNNCCRLRGADLTTSCLYTQLYTQLSTQLYTHVHMCVHNICAYTTSVRTQHLCIHICAYTHLCVHNICAYIAVRTQLYTHNCTHNCCRLRGADLTTSCLSELKIYNIRRHVFPSFISLFLHSKEFVWLACLSVL